MSTLSEEQQKIKEESKKIKEELKAQKKQEYEDLKKRRNRQEVAAEKAYENSSKKKTEWYLNPYYLTFGGLGFLLVYVIIMLFLNRQQPLNKIPVYDDAKVKEHNSLSQWKQGPSTFWEGATLLDAKMLMGNSFASHTNINRCIVDETLIVPDSFDTRTAWPECKLPVQDQTRKCSSGYAIAISTTFSERECIVSSDKHLYQLSAQDIISCDISNKGCKGGYLNNALEYISRYGLTVESCMPYKGSDSVKCSDMCSDTRKEHAEAFCVAFGEEDIKREIMKNGPVVATMEIYTDFLTYKSGVYYKGDEVPKFSTMQSVKVVGWGVESGNDDEPNAGNKYWIIENSWGEDWGIKGYAKISTGQGMLFEQYSYSIVTREQAQKMKKDAEEKQRSQGVDDKNKDQNIEDMNLDDDKNDKKDNKDDSDKATN